MLEFKYLVESFLTRLEKDFASKMATKIQNQQLQTLLVHVMCDAICFNPKNPAFQSKHYDYLRVKNKTKREQIAFRSAYLFETLYFKDKNILFLLKDDFVKLVSSVTNESAKRHFGKILTKPFVIFLISFHKTARQG